MWKGRRAGRPPENVRHSCALHAAFSRPCACWAWAVREMSQDTRHKPVPQELTSNRVPASERTSPHCGSLTEDRGVGKISSWVIRTFARDVVHRRNVDFVTQHARRWAAARAQAAFPPSPCSPPTLHGPWCSLSRAIPPGQRISPQGCITEGVCLPRRILQQRSAQQGSGNCLRSGHDSSLRVGSR